MSNDYLIGAEHVCRRVYDCLFIFIFSFLLFSSPALSLSLSHQCSAGYPLRFARFNSFPPWLNRRRLDLLRSLSLSFFFSFEFIEYRYCFSYFPIIIEYFVGLILLSRSISKWFSDGNFLFRWTEINLRNILSLPRTREMKSSIFLSIYF